MFPSDIYFSFFSINAILFAEASALLTMAFLLYWGFGGLERLGDNGNA